VFSVEFDRRQLLRGSCLQLPSLCISLPGLCMLPAWAVLAPALWGGEAGAKDAKSLQRGSHWKKIVGHLCSHMQLLG